MNGPQGQNARGTNEVPARARSESVGEDARDHRERAGGHRRKKTTGLFRVGLGLRRSGSVLFSVSEPLQQSTGHAGGRPPGRTPLFDRQRRFVVCTLAHARL